MTDTILKAAVVGTGHLGRHHTRILSRMPGIEFIGAYDANPEQLEAITTEHGVAAIPPSSFFQSDAEEGRRLARFAFCKKMETLEAAAERLGSIRG